MIRRAAVGDAATVARIHVESWNVAYRGIMPDDVIARTDVAYRTTFWRERLADPKRPVFVVEDDGAAVAFCHMIASADPDDDPTRVGQITALHVLPQLRGRGYGRALLDRALEEFRKLGLVEATLWVLEQNAKARAFYERCNFHLDGGRKMHSRTTAVPEVRYRTNL